MKYLGPSQRIALFIKLDVTHKPGLLSRNVMRDDGNDFSARNMSNDNGFMIYYHCPQEGNISSKKFDLQIFRIKYF